MCVRVCECVCVCMPEPTEEPASMCEGMQACNLRCVYMCSLLVAHVYVQPAGSPCAFLLTIAGGSPQQPGHLFISGNIVLSVATLCCPWQHCAVRGDAPASAIGHNGTTIMTPSASIKHNGTTMPSACIKHNSTAAPSAATPLPVPSGLATVP